MPPTVIGPIAAVIQDLTKTAAIRPGVRTVSIAPRVFAEGRRWEMQMSGLGTLRCSFPLTASQLLNHIA
ncbi:MAG: hypothetical protein BJ554DRAFT_2866 [Olpidium bornovanus]|uniref:Uncharacterized protein n=1 Tax=Olpidium bornovanus TaxID=278681 RepID=A0A8H7ZQ61_9FUNG|nr:MAG: hypothetical protein BJ554DRAFT_2866 [Olpidium bornovanus]